MSQAGPSWHTYVFDPCFKPVRLSHRSRGEICWSSRGELRVPQDIAATDFVRLLVGQVNWVRIVHLKLSYGDADWRTEPVIAEIQNTVILECGRQLLRLSSTCPVISLCSD